MKTLLPLTLLFAGTIAAHAQSAPAGIADLKWLAGCWESNNAEKKLLISEQWMKPAGGMMIGAGRTVRDGKTVDFEFVRIVEEPDGIFYIAKPKSNPGETRFKLIKSSAAEAIFENPAHDFPQRVMYRRDGDRLAARIEGIQNGKTRGLDFPMSKVQCE